MSVRNHQSINLRQLCWCYFMYSLGIKILSLPAILARGSGTWAWVTAGMGVLFEIIIVLIATLILKFCNPKGRSFRILCWLCLPLIIAEIWLTGLEIYRLAYTDLFTNLGIVVFMITLTLLGGFFITRTPRAVFRASEILWLFFALGLIIAIAPTLYNLAVDWPQLLSGNFATALPTLGSNLLFFESATFIIAFGSETKKTNRELVRLNCTAILCGIGYFLFSGLFIILFGNLAAHKPMGLVELTSMAQFLTNSGSLDWLIVMAMMTALIVRFGVQLVAVITLIKRGLNKND